LDLNFVDHQSQQRAPHLQAQVAVDLESYVNL